MPQSPARDALGAMSFSVLALRNLFRQWVRTLLTVLGISIGITTVVALGAITSGLKSTMGRARRRWWG